MVDDRARRGLRAESAGRGRPCRRACRDARRAAGLASRPARLARRGGRRGACVDAPRLLPVALAPVDAAARQRDGFALAVAPGVGRRPVGPEPGPRRPRAPADVHGRGGAGGHRRDGAGPAHGSGRLAFPRLGRRLSRRVRAVHQRQQRGHAGNEPIRRLARAPCGSDLPARRGVGPAPAATVAWGAGARVLCLVRGGLSAPRARELLCPLRSGGRAVGTLAGARQPAARGLRGAAVIRGARLRPRGHARLQQGPADWRAVAGAVPAGSRADAMQRASRVVLREPGG